MPVATAAQASTGPSPAWPSAQPRPHQLTDHRSGPHTADSREITSGALRSHAILVSLLAMIAHLYLDDSRVKGLGRRLQGGQSFTTMVPQRTLKLGKAEQLCLLTAGGILRWEYDKVKVDPVGGGQLYIIALGRIRSSPRPSTTDDRVNLIEPHLIYELAISDLIAAMPKKYRIAARSFLSKSGGVVEGPTESALISALLRTRPGLSSTVRALRRHGALEPVSGETGRVMALERDAVHLALSVAGMPTDALRDWRGEQSEGFLAGLSYDTPEDVLLGHDAIRLPSWRALPSERPDWLIFTDGEQRIRIGNVNRTKLENVLGVDLIYRHLDADMFVLVQYKRFRQSIDGEWFYLPDKQLDKELVRMRKIDALDSTTEQATPATWRLHSRGCYLKIVRPPKIFDPSDDQLMRGMYLPLEYLDELWASRPKGKGSRRLDYNNVDRYLTGSLFISLVRQGWVGTRGASTKHIATLVDAALSNRRSVIIAEEWGNIPGRVRRKGRRPHQ